MTADDDALKAARRRKIAYATKLWGLLALSGVGLLSAMAIWHLVRRGRLVRANLGPPRPVRPLEAPTTETT
jgi:hypothetical protein